MPDSHKLYFGPYHPPRFRIGGFLRCAIRGDVEVTSISDAPIPWPRTRVPGGHPLIVCGGLLKALRNESAVAVRHHWGIGADTVWKLRKSLGVEEWNVGSRRLISNLKVELGPDGWQAMHETLDSPERAAKIAAAKRGKPRPPHIIEAMRRANLGRKQATEERRKRSETHKRRGTRPPGSGRPFTPEEDALLAKLPLAEAARQTGRNFAVLWRRRKRLGIPPPCPTR